MAKQFLQGLLDGPSVLIWLYVMVVALRTFGGYAELLKDDHSLLLGALLAIYRMRTSSDQKPQG
jgi:hypothetical protein